MLDKRQNIICTIELGVPGGLEHLLAGGAIRSQNEKSLRQFCERLQVQNELALTDMARLSSNNRE